MCEVRLIKYYVNQVSLLGCKPKVKFTQNRILPLLSNAINIGAINSKNSNGFVNVPLSRAYL